MTGRRRFTFALGATALGLNLFFVHLSGQSESHPTTICHHSIEAKAFLTITVPASLVPQHLAHGDTLGACVASGSR